MGKFFTGFVHVVKHIMKPFFPVKWYGPRKFEQKRTILVGNHISGWDPVVFSIWCRTPVSFMYKAEFQKSCFLRAVFNGLDFIPVHRGEVDIAATKRTLKLLRQEKIVALFPEGTRSPDVDKMLPLKTAPHCLPSGQRRPSDLSISGKKPNCSEKITTMWGMSLLWNSITISRLPKRCLPRLPKS